MTDVQISTSLLDSLSSDFDVLAAACWSEVEDTASPETLSALHSPQLRHARADGLHYVQTILEGELQILTLSHKRRERETVTRAHQRAQALRVAAIKELRAERGHRHRADQPPRDLDLMSAWLLKLVLPEDYSHQFDLAMASTGIAPERGRLPNHEWWAWAVEHGWMAAEISPDADRLLALADDEFDRTVRRSLTVEYVAGLDENPVIERWRRALSRVEVRVRTDMQRIGDRARQARPSPCPGQLSRVRELYEEFASLRVHRSVAQRLYNELRDAVATNVNAADAGLVDQCHVRAAAALAEANPSLWQSIREVVTAHRARWERDDFDFSMAAELAEELLAEIPWATPHLTPADTKVTSTALDNETREPLEVAVDASGYAATGGYGWTAADGRTGSGHSTAANSATEGEVIAICEAVLAPELRTRPLHILSDCTAAVDAVTSALATGSAGAFPISQPVRERLHAAIQRPVPFTVHWIPSRTGHHLHDRAHRLARTRRHH
ncbi:hypothetical protein [Nocardia cerradoensis]|uniref:RNase H type-1 domain-containing protein n=1 Tax=Nocardia cerradoensis TaxID=85688 RepID=A0A231H2M3_9NOCA|nr:hypothetical protein [Nocardia cerradoensis]NKY43536.1 hypothetical protein [Nocardia cerradoensis]OXR43113.1 hypothetical protein B7C42_04999 [Nocardia cerradoensis]